MRSRRARGPIRTRRCGSHRTSRRPVSRSICRGGTRGSPAPRAHLVGDYMVLEGFTLANAAGTLGADALILSQGRIARARHGGGGRSDGRLRACGRGVRRALPSRCGAPRPTGRRANSPSRFSAARLTAPRPDRRRCRRGRGRRRSTSPGWTASASRARPASPDRPSSRWTRWRSAARPRALTQAAQAVIRLAEAPTGEDARAALALDHGLQLPRPASGLGPRGVRHKPRRRSAPISARPRRGSRSLWTTCAPPSPCSAGNAGGGDRADDRRQRDSGDRRARLGGRAVPAPRPRGRTRAMREDRLRLRLACLAAPGVVDLATEIDVTLPEGNGSVSRRSIRGPCSAPACAA